eukprot:CAMPEP_0194706812 /NCGR_PEP_ID=MMETSP0295-20121207/29781_1 /TAXON_ID=39354 /ORGANISM="Heterosigma akashiwo, Strain CCMP2393" /LENGTH=649 /DNA_ID=CAMNT_0039602819 /DNA_START=182 /DNA_END=2132 /DNA_ORIENTATION=-
MEEIQFIVSKLNEPPFSLNMQLVDFDEKSPLELLQILNDVFSEMDSQMKMDVRDEPEEARANRMMMFLAMLKFKIPDESRDTFTEGLMYGEKTVVYPILHWVLQRLPALQKRAYLARYLMPIEVPADFLQDETLSDIYARYKEMQNEFKAVHKTVDQLRASDLKPGELKAEITQLEDERKQLADKIERLKRQVASEEGFEAMLAATSRLRQEQEEEAKLAERAREQRFQLHQAEARAADAGRRLAALKDELSDARRRLQELEAARLEPQKTREDVDQLEAEVEHAQAECQELREAVEQALKQRGDQNLIMSRHAAALAAKKLAAKEEEMERLQGERQRVAAEIEEHEGKASAAEGPNREEMKSFADQLRAKTAQYRALKKELGELRAESVVLHRTEQVLKARDQNLDDFLRQLETKKGVRGYRETHETLVKASEQAQMVDAEKGETLDEISEIVRKITQQLKEKKGELAPQIKQLRDTRKEYKEVEGEYLKKRSVYEKVAVGLEVEKQELETACTEKQDGCLQEESRYHYLQCLKHIAEATLDKVRQEEKYQKGKGRLLPEIQTFQDLYKNKEQQQKNMANQLRKRQKEIKENEGSYMKQRAQFANLKKLLDIKLNAKKAQASAKSGLDMFGNDASDFGSANVMTLDQP